MNRVKRPRVLVAAGGGIATLALAGTLFAGNAFAQSSTTATPGTAQGSQPQGQAGGSDRATQLAQFEQSLAQNLGIGVDKLKSALQQTADQAIDAKVASGQLTQDQATQLKQRVDSGQDVPFLFGGGFGGRHGGHDGFGGDQGTIAGTLGITPQQLQSELQSGKALKDIISEHGKTVADVVTAVVNQEKSELDQQVSAGKLTADQETQRLNDLQQRLTDAINNNQLPGPHGGVKPNHSATPSG